MTPSRRTILSASGALVGAAALPAQAASPAGVGDAAWLQAVVERYAGFGIKASGGPGDEASGVWLEGELHKAGYATERQGFQVPFFEPINVTLTSGATRATVIPQAVVTPTGPEGISAPLRLADRSGDLNGAIALIVLPFKRWGGIADPQFSRPVAEAISRGAAAVVAITTGPTGEAIALNAPPDRPAFNRPVAILAPKDAAPFVAAAANGATGNLTVFGRGGMRPAWNLIGRLDRKARDTVIVSTPRSGWFTCAAERGSGLAAWLALAYWLKGRPGHNVELLATSGHEYIYLGGEKYLHEKAPRPDRTRLWTHIGASFAARDWHELFPAMRPLDTADPQRVLTATADILAPVKKAFHGLPGLEATYLADKANAGGELVNVIEAGYRSAIGEYGIHRYFHTQGDDMRCTSGDLIRPASLALQSALAAIL